MLEKQEKIKYILLLTNLDNCSKKHDLFYQ